ncbi:MAG TPA: twin-arginine translocase TatA/TatE family subunit, partial [Chthoniobacteraceae bacterium]|nr:twin-arginine translocase TatA/TatE family subunit [Chthoniobacteraceae bacterium]
MYLAALPNLFGPDGLVLFLIILLLFGAKKLPELARGLGQAVREF